MALIQCKNCGHMVSDKATKCPKCRTDLSQPTEQEQDTLLIEEERKSNRTLYVIIAIVLVALCAGSFFIFHGNNESADSNTANSSFVSDTMTVSPEDSFSNDEKEDNAVATDNPIEKYGLQWMEGGWIDLNSDMELTILGNRILVEKSGERHDYKYCVNDFEEYGARYKAIGLCVNGKIRHSSLYIDMERQVILNEDNNEAMEKMGGKKWAIQFFGMVDGNSTDIDTIAGSDPYD